MHDGDEYYVGNVCFFETIKKTMTTTENQNNLLGLGVRVWCV